MHTKSLAFVVKPRRKQTRSRLDSQEAPAGAGAGAGACSLVPNDPVQEQPPTAPPNFAVKLSVVEQRWSGLMQSVLVGACLGLTPAIRCIPTAVLWGYFAFMAIESLPGSQLWDRTLLLLTDPKRYVPPGVD